MKVIAIIEGGYSHEKVISVKSAATVFNNIDLSLYKPIRVCIDNNGWYAFENGVEYEINKNNFTYNNIKFDYAFIVIHGTPGEDGKLQAYFDMLDIPYSTSSHLASTLTFNKYICNQYLKNFNINVAKAVLIKKNDLIDAEKIIDKVGLPCFVKPVDGGSSFGVTKVKQKQDLKNAILTALKHGTQAVIEEYLIGREVTNGVYKTSDGVKVLPITEIVTPNEFFDFAAKYNGESNEITPADLTDELTSTIKKETKKIYQLLDLNGICRADYILKNGIPYLIEINTVPGQSKESIIPQMAQYEGVSLKELFNNVIATTINK